ncbi:MAG: hypothetical protein M1393_07100 [Candidatus Thermoplasmatota archaeon]|nr:hypothetical protein [Candidatus Thermoplasmatota archaeon]
MRKQKIVKCQVSGHETLKFIDSIAKYLIYCGLWKSRQQVNPERRSTGHPSIFPGVVHLCSLPGKKLSKEE